MMALAQKTHLLIAAMTVAAACGDIGRDPAFTDWCGPTLCQWQLMQGSIERTATWHAHDYGVALGPDTIIFQDVSSQGADKHLPSCINFTAVSNLKAGSELYFDMDFHRDGDIELSLRVPEADWMPVRFDQRIADELQKARFLLRNAGTSPATLAQIKVAPSTGCPAESPPN